VFAGRRAERLGRPQMRALGKQPGIKFAEHRAEAVGIVDQRRGRARPVHPQPIAARRQRGQAALEDAVGVHAEQIGQHRRARRSDGPYRLCAGKESPQAPGPRAIRMRPEHAEGIGMPGLEEGSEVVGAHRSGSTRQMRLAYSRMLRSEENAPMPATLAMARAVQSAGRR